MLAEEVRNKFTKIKDEGFSTSVSDAIHHGWKSVGNSYFRARDTLSMSNILGNQGVSVITKSVAWFTPAGLAFILKTDNGSMFFVLSIRRLAIVIVSPIVAGLTVTRQMRVLREPKPGVLGINNVISLGSKSIAAGIWQKLNPYARPPDMSSVATQDEILAYTEVLVLRPSNRQILLDFQAAKNDVNLPFLIDMSGYVDFNDNNLAMIREQNDRFVEELSIDGVFVNLPKLVKEDFSSMILVESSASGHQTIRGYIPGLMRSLLVFIAILPGVGAPPEILEFYDPTIEKVKAQEPDEEMDIISDFEKYLRTQDPVICEKYTFTGEATPASSWMSALDRLPWHQLNVSREDAIACVQLQNKIMSDQDVFKVSMMVDRISEEIERGEFEPERYRLIKDEGEGTTKPVTQLSAFEAPMLKHDGQWALSSLDGWSLFEQGKTIGGFIYNKTGELYRIFKENEVLFIFGIGSALTSSVLMQTRIPSGIGAGSTALSIAGSGINYIYSMHRIVPLSKEQIQPILMQGYSMLPSRAWLWATGTSTGTYVMTTSKQYPAAVFTAAAAYYYRDDIKKYGVGVVGLALLGVGAALFLDRKGIKRKLKI
jgi:hypothetical protein